MIASEFTCKDMKGVLGHIADGLTEQTAEIAVTLMKGREFDDVFSIYYTPDTFDPIGRGYIKGIKDPMEFHQVKIVLGPSEEQANGRIGKYDDPLRVITAFPIPDREQRKEIAVSLDQNLRTVDIIQDSIEGQRHMLAQKKKNDLMITSAALFSLSGTRKNNTVIDHLYMYLKGGIMEDHIESAAGGVMMSLKEGARIDNIADVERRIKDALCWDQDQRWDFDQQFVMSMRRKGFDIRDLGNVMAMVHVSELSEKRIRDDPVAAKKYLEKSLGFIYLPRPAKENYFKTMEAELKQSPIKFSDRIISTAKESMR